jgi:Superinfection immunity protein
LPPDPINPNGERNENHRVHGLTGTKIPSFLIAFLKLIYGDDSEVPDRMHAYPSLCAVSTNSPPTLDHSWLIACLLTATYFAPALVAFLRRQQNRWLILGLNFLFGWTVVGWIICLAWATWAPSGEPVVIVQTAPQLPPASVGSFLPGPRHFFNPLARNLSESTPFQPDKSGVFPDRRSSSIKLFLFRIAAAGIALAVIAGVTTSQWRSSNLPLLPKNRVRHVPQIRNIDPYTPIPPSAPRQRHYPSPASRSHEGYY